MTKRERLLAALLAERFDATAIESEAVELAEPDTIRLARVIQARVEDASGESDERRGDRRAELLCWPEPSAEQLSAVPPRHRARSWLALVGKPRASMDDLTLSQVRAADAERKRFARRPA